MFVIACNSRESYGTATVTLARTVDDARQKFVTAWGQLYDTSTASLYQANEDDLSTTEIFTGYSDAQVPYDPEDEQGEQEDASETEYTAKIQESELARLDEALAPYSAD